MDTQDYTGAPKASPNDQKLDLNRFLPYRLSNLADRISDELARFYAERYSLSIAQWRVLAWLSHSQVLNAKQIRTATRMDKARVSRAVHALVERGLISRSPATHDQRHHDLHLTSEGQALLGELIPEAEAWEATLVETLTAGEHQDFLRIITKLEEQLDQFGSVKQD